MGANRNEFIENASKILLSKSEEYKYRCCGVYERGILFEAL